MDQETPANVTDTEALLGMGYRPLGLRWHQTGYEHPLYGLCLNFDVCDPVPSAPGTYIFTIDRDAMIEVRYVGKTEHLWMVTLGKRPPNQPRGGQRYGRPRHAGDTRQWVSAGLSPQAASGLTVRQWVRPVPSTSDLGAVLLKREREDIARWDSRRLGLNRQ